MAAPPSAEPDNARERLLLGVLGRPHGVRGELLFHPFNEEGDGLLDLALPVEIHLEREGVRRTVRLLAARPFQDRALVRLEGVDDRDAAAALTNFELGVARAHLPALAPDELYIDDLIGCQVLDVSGQPRGKVVSTFWNGGHDVLTIRDDANQELLIPFVPEFLQDVDLDARRIVIDPHE